jgi:hypothetical protein
VKGLSKSSRFCTRKKTCLFLNIYYQHE